MSRLKKLLNYINGAKTLLGLAIYVLWTGALELDIVEVTNSLNTTVVWAYTSLGGVGLLHKAKKNLG